MQSNSVIKAKLKIRAQAGDTFTRRFSFFSDDAFTIPLDLTNYSFKLQVKDVTGTVLLVWLNTDFTFISTGVYEITKTSAEMDVTPDDYSYDLQVTYPTSEERTWAFGEFEIVNQKTS